ncbi:hypothetical protein GGI02_001087 [Coemansia sp. RSA 2322]|nr:hypothetical protein GGI02_001087 [Coemansia sp. RSA 2322]
MQGMEGQQGGGGGSDGALHDASGLAKFSLGEGDYHSQSLATAVAAAAAAAAAQQQAQSEQQAAEGARRSPAPMFPGPSTIPTNFSSGMINSAESLQQFQSAFWKAHTASVEDNTPDFKLHLLPLARIKKVMKSDPDVKVQMISAEAPILFSKACEIFITEITQRAWMNAEENKRRTLQRQDVSCAAQRSEMFDFLIDVVPREEFAKKPAAAPAKDDAPAAGSQHALQQQPPAPQPRQASVDPAAQQQPPQPQSAASLYGDSAIHQYYAQHLADAAGFSQPAGPMPEQRQTYYQQIEREQMQWLQRQTAMPAPPGPAPPFAAQQQRLPVSPHMQQQQQAHDLAAAAAAAGMMPKPEPSD